MSNKIQSWERLRREAWCSNPLLAKKNDPSARFQRLSEGVGPYNHDEYAITVDSLPQHLSPIKYLREFAMNLNKSVDSSIFNGANKFVKRNLSRLELGDIWDIDILGPDNGSIVLVALSDNFGKENVSSWFDIQTIECNKYGTHPECGTREFGFEILSGGVKFYTRGVSRAYTQMHRMGSPIQKKSWVAMMNGIISTLTLKGAKISHRTVIQEKVQK